jgi:surface antigen
VALPTTWAVRHRAILAAAVLAASLLASIITAIPAGAVQGAIYLCGPRADYGCTGGGYQGRDPWGYWQYGSLNQYGRHNCTSYAAFRAAQNGARNPGNLGDAKDWDDNARRYGIPVDGTPAVGAIAQWNAGVGGTSGHVAYVEELGSDYVITSDDNFGYNTTSRQRITRTSGGWPSSFIHLKDLTATRDLAYVKWAPTGSGRIEVHTATAASAYASFGIHAATPIAAGDTNGVFDMADVNADGRADLVYIKRRNTGSGRIELHWVNAATGYSSFGGNLATVFSAGNDPNGSFEMADMNGDRRADLVFAKTRNTGSGRVELHWADAASGYVRFGANLVTALSPADAGNGYFHPADMNADGRTDLAFVKIRNTGSGRIEIHWADAAAGYRSFGGHHATALNGGERNNGWFETTDMNGDRTADLVFIKDYNVGSGRIELHWLDARAGFSRLTASAATVFSAAEAGHGFFTVT